MNGTSGRRIARRGINIGADLKDAYQWTPGTVVTSLGRYPGEAITGAVRLFGAGIDDATIRTPQLGWMRLVDFLQCQGVLEASRWQILGAEVAANGKVLVGTAAPLAADYVHTFRLELDQVYVCTGKGRGAKTVRVGFPDAMEQFLAKGATVGLCPGDAPL